MAQGVLLPPGECQFFDLTGEPLNGGLVYMYEPGTTTPKISWVDQNETVPNTNPIRLDSLGRCIIWGSGTYRQLVTDSAGNQIWDQLTSDSGIGNLQSEINTINSEIATIEGEITALQTAIAGPKFWFKQTNGPSSGTYVASITDSATLFLSSASGGALTIQLPDVTTLRAVAGWWFAGIIRVEFPISFQVNGSQGEVIFVPSVGGMASVATANAIDENLIVSFDGNNFHVVSASPRTWAALGAVPVVSVPNSPLLGGNGSVLVPVGVGDGLILSSGILSATGAAKGVPMGGSVLNSSAVTIEATALKITAVAGGAGGSATFGGGSGAGGVQFLTGLTIGSTLNVSIGAAGGPGSAGGDTIIASGSQTISTIHYGGGQSGGGGGAVLAAPYDGISSPGGQGTEVGFIASGNSIAAGAFAGWLGSYGNGGQAGNPGGPSPGIQGAVLLEWIA